MINLQRCVSLHALAAALGFSTEDAEQQDAARHTLHQQLHTFWRLTLANEPEVVLIEASELAKLAAVSRTWRTYATRVQTPQVIVEKGSGISEGHLRALLDHVTALAQQVAGLGEVMLVTPPQCEFTDQQLTASVSAAAAVMLLRRNPALVVDASIASEPVG